MIQRKVAGKRDEKLASRLERRRYCLYSMVMVHHIYVTPSNRLRARQGAPLCRQYARLSDGVRGSKTLPWGYGTILVRHQKIARWHWPRRHKGRAGRGSNNPPPICVFPYIPSEVTPPRPTPPVANGRSLTGLGRMRGRGSGSHLTRDYFAGSKPLHR